MLSVKQYQTNLKHYYAYYTGDIDGVVGTKTKSAVKSFQKANGLTADGIYGTNTNSKLVSKIKNLQTLLNKNGAKLDVDGIVGAKTISAIKAFQKKKGLTQDGIAGTKTMNALSGKSSSSNSSNNSSNTGTSNKYSKYLIYINPGHGASDPGACRYVNGKLRAKEKDMALSTAKYLNSYLKDMGFKTGMTRTGDTEITLVQRANKANKAKASLYISIHFNAGGGDGLELIVHPTSSKGYKLAQHLKDHITKETGQNFRRYIKRADYDVRGTNMPAVIIEGCFMDNTKDFSLISTVDKRKKLAKSYANGIKSYIDSL